MCLNNTVCDVLSSHRHHQPLGETVATPPKAGKRTTARTKTLVFDLCPSLGLDTWEQKKCLKYFFPLSFNHVEVELVILGGLKDTYLSKYISICGH